MSKQYDADHAANLHRRIEQAQRESRWKDALDLARKLVADAATEEGRALLRSAALGFARSLAERGRTRDLSAELPRLMALFPDDGKFAAALGEIAVQAGLHEEGLRLMPPEARAEQAARVRLKAADDSVRQWHAGRASLPADLHADHGRILEAFTLIEQGKDDEARAVLQGVGLRSPFAEWRLYLRGLQSYYAGDDARAIEAWAKLSPQRPPFRLAAPFRFGIDPAFRDAQPAAVRKALQKQALSLNEGDQFTATLRGLQQGIAKQRSLSKDFSALHKQKAALDALPAEQRERLARLFYWLLLPAPEEERLRYRRTFVPPREDPKLLRLQALGLERAGQLYDAIAIWQNYERDIAADGSLWGEDSQRVRALIWLHVGRLAAVPPEDLLDDEEFAGPFGFLMGGRGTKAPPKPPVDFAVCYEQARTLAPDLPEAYILPIQSLLDREDYERARPLAVEMRQRFPDNVDAQMTAAMVFADLDDIPEALACTEQALRINPLDQRVRDIRRGYALALVLYHVRAGNFAAARAAVAGARPLCETPRERTALRVQEATIDWKEGILAPIQALRQELEAETPRAVVVYMLVINANAAKIDRKSKAPLDKEFNAILAGEPTLEETMELARMVVAQGALGSSPYYGYKSHRTKVTKKLVGFADDKKLTLRQYVELGLLYEALDARRAFSNLAHHPPRGIPQAAVYYLQFRHALSLGRLPLWGGPPWELGHAEQNLNRIRDEADRAYLRDRIERDKKEHDFGEVRNPFEFFGGFDPFGGGPDDDYDDLDEEPYLRTDPYKVLELPPTADEAAIRKRYLELVKRYPPERDPVKFAEIRAAYEALRNRDERLRKQLFEGDRDAHLDNIVEEIACRAGRPRVASRRLLAILGDS